MVKELQMFEQNHVLTICKKCKLSKFSNINLFVGYEGFFVSRTSLNTLFEQFEPKKRGEETSNF